MNKKFLLVVFMLTFSTITTFNNTVYAKKDNKNSCLIQKTPGGKIEYNIKNGKDCTLLRPVNLNEMNKLSNSGKEIINNGKFCVLNTSDYNHRNTETILNKIIHNGKNYSVQCKNGYSTKDGKQFVYRCRNGKLSLDINNSTTDNDCNIISGCFGLPTDNVLIENSSIDYDKIPSRFKLSRLDSTNKNKKSNVSQIMIDNNYIIEANCEEGYMEFDENNNPSNSGARYICDNGVWKKKGKCVKVDTSCGNFSGEIITNKGDTKTITTLDSVDKSCCDPSKNKFISIDKRLMHLIGIDRYYTENWEKRDKGDKLKEIFNSIYYVDLECVDLSDVKLNDADLSKKAIYFSYGDGTSSNLKNANFSGTIFGGFTYFGFKGNSGSDLTNANFSKTKFKGDVHFAKHDTSGSNLEKANFSEALFDKNVYFGEHDKSISNLSGANFSGAVFNEIAYFGLDGNSRTNLARTNFSKARFNDFVYFGAYDNSGSNLAKANFSEASFKKNVYFGERDNSGSYLAYANFSGAEFNDVVCFGANDNSGSNLGDSNFSGAEFKNAVYFGAIHNSGSNLNGANFSGARFAEYIYPNNSNFCGARFSTSKFYGDNSISQRSICPDGVKSLNNNCDGHMNAINTADCPKWSGANNITGIPVINYYY